MRGGQHARGWRGLAWGSVVHPNLGRKRQAFSERHLWLAGPRRARVQRTTCVGCVRCSVAQRSLRHVCNCSFCGLHGASSASTVWAPKNGTDKLGSVALGSCAVLRAIADYHRLLTSPRLFRPRAAKHTCARDTFSRPVSTQCALPGARGWCWLTYKPSERAEKREREREKGR